MIMTFQKLLVLTFALLSAVYATSELKWHLDEDESSLMASNVIIPPDDVTHDCQNIRKIDHANFKQDPVLRNLKKIKKSYVKFNHAYGIPILGVKDFRDESMLRACYLLRYLFAGNEWLRRYGKLTKLYLSGNKGGWCCPPQMGNNGLSCSCGVGVKYPFTGRGAPAHEMAHWFIKRMLVPMARDGRLKVPTFKNDKFRNYTETDYLKKKDDKLSDFLLNSYHQDHARGSTKIKDEKLHHYFIYTGQEKLIIKNGGLKKAQEDANRLKTENKNLYAILKQVWQCENDYVMVCKDAAYDFTKGLSQRLTIAQVDPEDPQKMICNPTLDQPELRAPKPIINVSRDVLTDKKKCEKVVKKSGSDVKGLKKGDLDASLGNDQDDMGNEYVWFLRRCCAKTAKFSFV